MESPSKSRETETERVLRSRIDLLEQIVASQKEHINILELFKGQCICQSNSSNVFLVNEFDLETENNANSSCDGREKQSEITDCRDQDKDSESAVTTITATTEEGGRSLSDFEDEEIFGATIENDGVPSPNLGSQALGNFPDLQEELDLQELTLARNSFNSNSKDAGIETTFTHDVDGPPLFSDENEIPVLASFDDAPTAEAITQEDSSLFNPCLLSSDVNMGPPLSEMSVRVGSDGDDLPFGKQQKSLFSQKNSGAQKIKCSNCEKLMLTKRDLETHLFTHNTVPSYVRHNSPETFKTKSCLAVHEASHKPPNSAHRKRKFKRRGPCSDSTYCENKELAGLGSSADEELILKSDAITSKLASNEGLLMCEFTFCAKEVVGSGERKYDCYSCCRKFRTSRNFEAHKLTHFGEKPFHCNICDLRFRELPELNDHIRQEHRARRDSAKKFLCTGCSKKSPAYENYLRPIIDCRLRSARRTVTIYKCYYAFCGNATSGLQLDYECYQCDKTCESIEFLKRHEEIHSGEMPFPCNICGKCFRTIVSLKDHIYHMHKDPMPNWNIFSCRTCDNSYRIHTPQRKILRTYANKVSSKPCKPDNVDNVLPVKELSLQNLPESCTKGDHSSTESPLFRLDEVMDMAGINGSDCSHVADVFHTKKKFEIFDDAGESGTPLSSINIVSEFLKCPECGVDHSDIRSLNRHLKTHRVHDWTTCKLDNPAKCPYCEKTYKFLKALRKHVDSVHDGQDTYICQTCGEVFGKELSLRDHIEKLHDAAT